MRSLEGFARLFRIARGMQVARRIDGARVLQISHLLIPGSESPKGDPIEYFATGLRRNRI